MIPRDHAVPIARTAKGARVGNRSHGRRHAGPSAGRLSRREAHQRRRRDSPVPGAAELLEADLWEQYNELGGIQDSEPPSGSGKRPYSSEATGARQIGRLTNLMELTIDTGWWRVALEGAAVVRRLAG
jgi:hypothetical protein